MPVIYYSYYQPISDSISEVNRQEHELGRTLLAHGLDCLLGFSLTPSELDDLLTYDSHGKPFLAKHPDIHFNITHCKGFAACAFHDRPIGIDAEMPGYFPDVLISRALSETEKCFFQSKSYSPSEREEWFYRLWTLKEAYVKKSGIGVDTDLTAFSFSFIRNGDDYSVLCSDSGVSCYQTKMYGGQILSVCYEDCKKTVKLIPYCRPLERQR